MVQLNVPVHLQVFCLIVSLFIKRTAFNICCNGYKLLSKILYFLCGLWIINPVASFLYNIFCPPVSTNKHGVVILTRVPIHDRVRSHNSSFLSGMKNSCFLERIMTENVASMLTDMRQKSIVNNLNHLELFICYKLNYTCTYEIKDWLEQLPDYKNRFDTEHFMSEPQIEKSMQTLQSLFEENISRGPDTNYDPDSYCRNKPERDPGVHKPRIFHYVSVQGRDFDRLLEVAIRAAFVKKCRDVVVVNPYVPGIAESEIQDALNYLSESSDTACSNPNRFIIGRTKRGGIYLLGVTFSAHTVLNIRRLTRNIVWGSRSAHEKITNNVLKLDWVGASLRSVLEEVDCVESLPLVPRHLGLPLNHLAYDTISVVIPTFNNEDHIGPTLESIVENFSRKRRLQIIVVDGRSTDETVNKVHEFARSLYHHAGANSPKMSPRVSRPTIKRNRRRSIDSILVGLNGVTTSDETSSSLNTIASNLGLIDIQVHVLPNDIPVLRGEQIRWGVQHYATGSALLLLQPATHLPLYWDTAMMRCLGRLGVVLGAFSFHLFLRDKYIHRKNIPWAIRCYALDLIINYRSVKFELPMGEQAFFLYSYYYHLLGGYSGSAIVDDLIMVQKAQQAGHIGISQAPVTVWPIRAMRHGFFRSLLLDNMLVLAYKLGASLETLRTYHSNIQIIDPEYLDGY